MWGTHDALHANKRYRVLRFLLTNVLNTPERFAHCLCETIKKIKKEAISIVTALKTLAKSNALRIQVWFDYLVLLAKPVSLEFMFFYSADKKMIFKPM